MEMDKNILITICTLQLVFNILFVLSLSRINKFNGLQANINQNYNEIIGSFSRNFKCIGEILGIKTKEEEND